MKKLLVFTVTAAMLLSLAACAQSAKPAANPTSPRRPKQPTARTHRRKPPKPKTFRSRIRGRIMIRRTMPCRPQASISLCRTRFPAARKTYRVLSADGDVMFEIIYASGEDETARIRKAPGADDVSGDYNEYAETETVDAGGVSVTMKGENGLVKLAIWTNGDYSYALSVENAIGQSDMAALVSNIQ